MRMTRPAAFSYAGIFAAVWLALVVLSALIGVRGLADAATMLIYPLAFYCAGYGVALGHADGKSGGASWSLTANEQVQVSLTLALSKHVPGWPGATDEQLEAVAHDVLAALPTEVSDG